MSGELTARRGDFEDALTTRPECTTVSYMNRRSEVYSWRVSPALKASLEESARRERRPVSRLLEEIVQGYLANRSEPAQEVAEQRRLHARAARFAGCVAGSAQRRAEKARTLVRRRLGRLRRAG